MLSRQSHYGYEALTTKTIPPGFKDKAKAQSQNKVHVSVVLTESNSCTDISYNMLVPLFGVKMHTAVMYFSKACFLA